MKTSVTKWGNSLGLRIPKAFAEQAGIVEGELEMQLEGDKIILQKPKFTLESLVAGITPENKHDVVDFGEPVGKEVW